ncbi:hypothetical protein MCEJIRE27_01410 [Candidatus Nanopelagicaceae bacterium]
MKTYLITYEDSTLRKQETVEASRYFLENGWFHFKDDFRGVNVLIIRELYVDRIDLVED